MYLDGEVCVCVGVYVCALVEREYHRCSFAGGQLIRGTSLGR